MTQRQIGIRLRPCQKRPIERHEWRARGQRRELPQPSSAAAMPVVGATECDEPCASSSRKFSSNDFVRRRRSVGGATYLVIAARGDRISFSWGR